MALILWSPKCYPTWSTRFQAFAETKGLLYTITGDGVPPNSFGRLGNDPTDVERVAEDAAEAAYRRALDDFEIRRNNFWCYLAMLKKSTRLMLIWSDCLDNKGLDDKRKALVLLQQRFRCDENVTMVSVFRYLARLQLKEDESLHNYFIRAQEL